MWTRSFIISVAASLADLDPVTKRLLRNPKANDKAKADSARKRWYENADRIAMFLSQINPYWIEKKWRAFMYEHLKLTEEEATLRLQGKYAEDIAKYDEIQNEAMMMADDLSQWEKFCWLFPQLAYLMLPPVIRIRFCFIIRFLFASFL